MKVKNLFWWCFLAIFVAGCTPPPAYKDEDYAKQINKEISDHPSAVGGYTYYVCDDGNDSNDGLTYDKPVKSFDKAISLFNQVNAGGAVLFCRGGKFYVDSAPKIANFNCTKDAPCVIGDYSKGGTSLNTALPEIINRKAWAVFNFQDGGNADHDEGYIIKNLKISGQSPDITSRGFFFYNDVDYVQIINVLIDSVKVAIQVGGASTLNPGADSINEPISVNSVKASNVLVLVSGNVTGTIEDIGNVATNISTLQTVTPSAADSGPFYVCDDGSDNNDGVSPNTPWRTFDRAMDEFNYLEAGEAILFCRGGEFFVEASHRLSNQNCTATEPCVIADYLPANSLSNERPVINSQSGETVFDFEDGGDADQDGGYVIKNLILKSSQPNKAAVFLYNDVDDVLINNLRIEGFAAGVYSGGANTPTLGSNKINERISLTNSEIVNNSGFGWLGGCSDCRIDSNLFQNNGYAKATLNHNIYFSGKADVSRNVIISNNTLKESAVIDGQCTGVSLVVHGLVENITIENNYIQEKKGGAASTCWGIALDPGWATEEKFENVVIKENTIINTGNVAIGCSSCVNATIDSNHILHEQEYGFYGIKVPDKTEDSTKTSGITVTNNSINISNTTSNYQSGISIMSKDLDVTLKGNKVYLINNNANCISVEGQKLDDLNKCQIIY